MRAPGSIAILTLAALILPAGSAYVYRMIEHREWNIPVEEVTSFALRNVRGSIEVIGWEREEIEISVVIRIRAASRHKAMKIYGKIASRIDRDAGNVSVRALLPKYRKDSPACEGNTTVWVEYSIRVPYSTALDIRSSSGNIGVMQVGGSFHLESERGSIDMLSRGGAGVIRSATGDIGCELAFLPPGGELRMKTSYGDVFLGIPSDTSAMLRARTRSGRVKARIEMNDVVKQKRKVIQGFLGNGDGKILLESAGGDVTIEGL